jgi:hypothetical protein
MLGAIAVVLFVGYSWISSGRGIDNAQRSIAAANRELQSSQSAAELAEVMRKAALELDSFSKFVAPDWTTAVEKLLASLPAEPMVTSVTFTSENGFVQARFTVAIPKEKMEEWQIALASSGAAVSIMPLDNSVEGPAEYLFNFAANIAPAPEGGI